MAEVIFDPATGNLDPDLDQQLEPFGSRILIVDQMRPAPDWRTFHLEPL